jgi:hypothetical protein
MPLRQALLDAGSQRFRAVFLTTVTTVGGLGPIMLERSLQAQVVIPMAITLSFGLAMSTIWVLVLVPSLYMLYARGQSFTRRFRVRTGQTYAELGRGLVHWWRAEGAERSHGMDGPARPARTFTPSPRHSGSAPRQPVDAMAESPVPSEELSVGPAAHGNADGNGNANGESRANTLTAEQVGSER